MLTGSDLYGLGKQLQTQFSQDLLELGDGPYCNTAARMLLDPCVCFYINLLSNNYLLLPCTQRESIMAVDGVISDSIGLLKDGYLNSEAI